MPPRVSEHLILVLRSPDEVRAALDALVNADGWTLVGPVQVVYKHPDVLYVATLERKV